jgi:hypothetical protein
MCRTKIDRWDTASFMSVGGEKSSLTTGQNAIYFEVIHRINVSVIGKVKVSQS